MGIIRAIAFGLVYGLFPTLASATLASSCGRRLEGNFVSEGFLTNAVRPGWVFRFGKETYVTESLHAAPGDGQSLLAGRLTKQLQYDTRLSTFGFYLDRPGTTPSKFFHVIGRATLEYPRQPVVPGKKPQKAIARFESFEKGLKFISAYDIVRIVDRNAGGTFVVLAINGDGLDVRELEVEPIRLVGEPTFLKLGVDESGKPFSPKLRVIGKLRVDSMEPVLLKGWQKPRRP